MEIGMVYDIDRFIFKDLINNKIQLLKQEFLAAHGLDSSNIPMYDTGSGLDIHHKWRMSVLKIMGEWNNSNISKYPTLTELVNYFGDRCRSAGYSILEPGGEVVTHTDTEEDHEKYIVVHVPLIVPIGNVGFRENNEDGKWIEGQCFILDVESPHSIWNYTDTPRVVVLLELLKEGSYAI
jgi:aspartyl/asparaginyl beta-hydroxylase (cupin superfamily)